MLMHAEVEKDNSKDTFASDDDAHKADMGPGSKIIESILFGAAFARTVF